MSDLTQENVTVDEFADIRPYEGKEFTDALARLLANKGYEVTVYSVIEQELKELSQKYPDQFILLEKGPQHSVTYRIPKKCVSIRPPYSAKRRKQQAEDARIHGLPFDEKEKNDDEDFQMG